MAKVFHREIESYFKTTEISNAAAELLDRVIRDENLKMESKIPLKVHFGENGNTSFIEPKNFTGIIAWLQSHRLESYYIETNAVYSGSRMTADKHLLLAKDHGFTQLPIIIADGARGEEYVEVEINKKHFRTCKIAKGFIQPKQMIVLSHFKGHFLAGYGGALKQLGMGCASRGGKLAQHLDAKPLIIPFVCRQCHVCAQQCPVNAISFGMLPKINHRKCVGCAACIAVCPHKAIFANPFKLNLSDVFREKIAEYAYAAQLGKKNIYITFAFNLTKNCDCIGKSMKPIATDFGVLASVDPVAVDQACLDIVERRERSTVFAGRQILDYAEKIGLGSKRYDLISI